MNMKKDRQKTEDRILDAVDIILRQQGFHSLGINAVAKEAGVSKVLIYRYFGDFKGLIRSYALQYDYWNTHSKEIILEKQNLLKYSRDLLVGQYEYLMDNKGVIEILKWQLSENNELTNAIDKKRESEGMEILNKIKLLLKDSDLDFEVFSTIITSGLYYLSMRSTTTDVYNSINLKSEEGRERIKKGIEQLVTLVMKHT